MPDHEAEFELFCVGTSADLCLCNSIYTAGLSKNIDAAFLVSHEIFQIARSGMPMVSFTSNLANLPDGSAGIGFVWLCFFLSPLDDLLP